MPEAKIVRVPCEYGLQVLNNNSVGEMVEDFTPECVFDNVFSVSNVVRSPRNIRLGM
jgi:hypothetical protein